MKALVSTIAALVLLTFSTCKKQSAEISLEKQIIGKWKLKSMGGGFTGKYVDVDPSRNTILELKKDRVFMETDNGELVRQGTYKIIEGATTDADNRIQYSDETYAQSFRLYNNSLDIGENWRTVYTRIK